MYNILYTFARETSVPYLMLSNGQQNTGSATTKHASKNSRQRERARARVIIIVIFIIDSSSMFPDFLQRFPILDYFTVL